MQTFFGQDETIGNAKNKVKRFVMSSTTCPYDGDFCQIKQDKFNRWKEAVEYAAKNRLNQVFLTSGDMFVKCPLENKTDCERYLRYCFIKNQITKTK